MGNIKTRKTDINNYNNIIAKSSKQKQIRFKRLLLLGPGSAGKSTIFKAIKFNKYDDYGLLIESRHVIRQNCVAGILTLLKKLFKLSDLHTDIKFPVDVQDKTMLHATLITEFASETFLGTVDHDKMKALANSIQYVWNLDAVKNTYEYAYKLSSGFAFPDNMDYYFNKIREIMSVNYFPSQKDMFNARVRTTGVVDYEYKIGDDIVKIVDVGGVRNERLKWGYSYVDQNGDKTDCVLYTCPLNHYCKVLFSDENKNALIECIELFDAICSGKRFNSMASTDALKDCIIVILLTKPDLFKQCLKISPLTVCFGNEYKGKRGDFNIINKLMLKIFDGSIIHIIPKDIVHITSQFIDLTELSLDVAYNHGIEFIKGILLEICRKAKRNVYTFVVRATDRTEVEKVMNIVYDIVLTS